MNDKLTEIIYLIIYSFSLKSPATVSIHSAPEQSGEAENIMYSQKTGLKFVVGRTVTGFS